MTIPILFVLDSSGSMFGEKIDAVNRALAEFKEILLPTEIAHHAQIGVLSFSSECEWITDGFISLSSYKYKPITAGGLTSLGAAIAEIGKRLTPNDLLYNNSEATSIPIIIFMSDGCPTDEWEQQLLLADKNPCFAKSVRLSFGIGTEVDENIMKRLSVPSEVVHDNLNWEEHARYINAHHSAEITRILDSLFFCSLMDGFSNFDESAITKSGRIMDKIIAMNLSNSDAD